MRQFYAPKMGRPGLVPGVYSLRRVQRPNFVLGRFDFEDLPLPCLLIPAASTADGHESTPARSRLWTEVETRSASERCQHFS